jgi:(2Fe-2S) ferredoxin
MRRIYIDVGGSTCPGKGSKRIWDVLQEAIVREGLTDQVELVASGCFGLCTLAPNMYVDPDKIWYSRFKPEDVEEIVKEHLLNNRPVARLIHHQASPSAD